RPRLGRGRLALLGAADATAPVVLAVQPARSANAHPYAVAGFGTAISAPVLVSLAALLRSLHVVNRAERQWQLDAERAALAAIELVSSGDKAVIGEPGRLAQLLDNLVSNAIKFTPDGGSVTLRVAAEDGAVVLEVSDSGIGIPESERARLFERFFRASTAVSRQIPGTGLGLHIAQAIVDAHGGPITVAGEARAGPTLRVELPPATVVAEVRA